MITKFILLVSLVNVIELGATKDFNLQWERNMPTEASCLLAQKKIKAKYAGEYQFVKTACIKLNEHQA
jgi:hypothetical protein